MSWNYAELSHMAKEAGGPEILVEKIINISKQEGHKEMIPVVAVASVVSVFTGIFIGKKSQKKKNQEIELLKKELIEGINEYDSSHNKPTT